MMEDLWTAFCGESGLSDEAGRALTLTLQSVFHPSSCINHVSIIGFDILLLAMLLFNMFQKSSSKSLHIPARYQGLSGLPIASAVVNGCLGIVYLGLGVWILEEKLRSTRTALPLNWWLLSLFQGFTWLVVGLTISIRGRKLPRKPSRLLSILAFLFSGVVCAASLFAAIFRKELSAKTVLDILSFPGATLLLLCAYKGSKYGDGDESITATGLYTPLNGESNGGICKSDHVTPFSKAGFFSKATIWWLNSLMKKGREKTLEEEDIPKLREEDRAESCYLQYLERLNKQKQIEPSSQPSVLRTIVMCHWKDILLSGFFALLKVLTVSACPLVLNAFILVAEGKGSFKYEGYALAIALFLSKITESISQRQWYLRSRLIGVKIKSLLTSAIYKKQLRLSNAAKLTHSGGEIMNYVTVDAYRIGEFPYWFHQTWTTGLQLCLALVILFRAVGLATIAALVVIVLTVICNAPVAKLQHKFQSKLMVAQDERLKASSEALVNMKVLKLYAWETHFKKAIERLRKEEHKWLSAVQYRKAYNSYLFWSSPVLVSAATFGACYFLKVPLHANNVFTFVATLRLVQDPIRSIPEVIGVVIQAKVAFERIVKFLEAPELQTSNVQKRNMENVSHSIVIKSADFSWVENISKATLRNINLEVRPGEKVAICGEVGSGKSSLLAAILGEIPNVRGNIRVFGKTAYVSQTAWIQTGTIQENILFGSPMDTERYRETLERCSLVKDLELLPYGDLTEIGERGVNLSGGQKQRIQLARALYQNADIYLLDDPFSAVDAHTATNLFNEYVMEALSGKTVLLVTHQVDFLPAFDSVLLMLDGEILQAAPYHHLLASSQEFQDLVNAHKETAGSERLADATAAQTGISSREIKKTYVEKQLKPEKGDQLIKREERETGELGVKPFVLYLKQKNGFLYFSAAVLLHFIFVMSQIGQNSWMAANVDNPNVSTLRLIAVYLLIGFSATFILLFRSILTVIMGLEASQSLFSQLLSSLFRAPMSFYDSTPLGRILSRVSSDLSIVDLDVPFNLVFACGATMNAYANLGVLAVVTWQVLFVSIPMIYVAISLQKYYFSTGKELMRINGTTKSLVANHVAESVSGAITIRAFHEEERFLEKNFDLIDTNASPYFHSFAANEWLILRLEFISATVLSSAALCMTLLPPGTFSAGFIGMALSYGLSLNVSLMFSIQIQCSIANYIISVERLDQYMNIPSEAPEVVEGNRPPTNWPAVGKVEIQNLQIRYRPDTPLVLRGISCIFEGGHKIGIVGRTGSGKSTLIGALFRLVEPAGGKIIVDGIDISTIGLHDLRSRFGIIPQDPTLFNGTVRYNLDKFISENPHLSMLENQCTSMKDLQKIHAHLLKTGLTKDTVVASRLLAFSASRAGDINYAYMVFRRIKKPNPFIWNTIIRGFSESQNPKTAVSLFIEMLVASEIEPQRLTYPSVFKAYSQVGLAKDGAQLHGRVIKLGLESDEFTRNAIIHMYANCGFLSDARKLFDEDLECDNVAWNSMIMGLFKCGEVSESKRLFDKMPSRDSVSWNSMTSGFVRNGKYAEALEFFGEMQKERIRPSEFTMVSLLNASAQLGAIGQGEWIHEYIKKNGIEMNGIVVTAITNMYCKCGSIEKALRVFEAAPNKGLSCWNTMIMGLAVNGCEEEAIELFSRLETSNFIPDGVSFLGVLTACNHSGKVEKARDYLSKMTRSYKIEPSIKHYSCMVNVLGRAGLLEEAEELIDNMPVKADAIIWGSLLSSCRKHSNIETAKRAAKRVIELDPNDSCGYVLMSNVYAASSRFQEAMKERLSMKEQKIEKEPGCSLIEVDGEVHEFIAGGRLHHKAPEIYSLLDELGFMIPEMG